MPATTSGALFMCYRNDIGTKSIAVGRTEIMHASTLPSFAQFSVWQEAEMNIIPEDTTARYFDESENNFRVSTQGIIEVAAASTLADGTYGNLFIEYEFEFFGEALDYEVTDVDTAVLTVTTSATTTAVNREPIVCIIGASTGTAPGASFAGDTPGEDDIVYGVVSLASADWIAKAFRVQGETADFTFSEGMGLYGVVNAVDVSASTDGYYLTWYSNLTCAQEVSQAHNASILDSPTVDGQLVWSAEHAATSFDAAVAFTLNCRFWSVGGD